jgi:RimJ/RimL family protein N-acetyltransferase
MSSWWPLFDLELQTERLVLRPARDEDFPGLLAAVDEGIHPPAEMPFALAWTDAEPAARRRSAVQWWWSARANWSVDKWNLPFAVLLDGIPIGIQDLNAARFPSLREVATASWLTMRQQGRGFGKEMRAAVLHFGFDCLGAQRAHSGAFTDNPASARVSLALGYRDNGRGWEAPRGQPKEIVNYLLDVADWRANEWSKRSVVVRGFEACSEMFTGDVERSAG